MYDLRQNDHETREHKEAKKQTAMQAVTVTHQQPNH